MAKMEVVANCGHLKNINYSKVLPRAFTEHGAIMLANILRSSRAIQTSIQIVKAFIHLREFLANNRDLAQKLVQLERKYDSQFKVVFDAIRELMTNPKSKNRKIGF